MIAAQLVRLRFALTVCSLSQIGLLTDEAIFSYKRQTIIPWDKRRKVVEALTGVDEVIAQHTHDYSPNLLALKPDYVVHVRLAAARARQTLFSSHCRQRVSVSGNGLA